MSEGLGNSAKKEAMKDIIRSLHRGLPVEKAKERFLKEVGRISSAAIAEIEQALIDEGMAVEEIQRFCNVHALLFESSLAQAVKDEESPSHPVRLLKLENREIEKLLGNVEKLFQEKTKQRFDQFKSELNRLLDALQGADVHYKRKENILFPYLERHDFTGPSKVMWGKHDEIRDLLHESLGRLQKLKKEDDLGGFRRRYIDPLVEEVRSMIFKEERILFPAALDKLSAAEWALILRESSELGYAFIEGPAETSDLTPDLKSALTAAAAGREGERVSLPTGEFSLEELTSVLNTLPVDITFIDRDDTVRYFSDNSDRIFVRTRAVLGRKVQNCHPPQSVAVVEKILDSFKNGVRDSVDFWLDHQGKFVYIRYFALRDETGAYLGTLEVTQDITDVRGLEGEKRILDEAGP